MSSLTSPLVDLGQVGARGLGRVLLLVGLQESLLDGLPVLSVDAAVLERLPPDQGLVSQNHKEFCTPPGIIRPLSDAGRRPPTAQ